MTKSVVPFRIGVAVDADRQSSRVVLLDLARVFAIVFMIQGHALDVLLAPAYRQGPAFNTWLFLRGLTAPMFFPLAGMSFAVSSVRHWDSYLAFSPALLRRLGRYVFFIVLGYLIHLPVKSFRDLPYLDAASWRGWLEVDVLQCVGLTLIFLQVLIWIAKTPRLFAGFSILCCVAVVMLTPVMWRIDWTSHVPLLIASLMNGNTGSFFPLFPWAGYILFGGALGAMYNCWWSDTDFARGLSAGALMILSGLCLNKIPFTLDKNADFWKTSPNLFLIRTGCVCSLLAIMAIVALRAPMPKLALRSLARESLAIYLVHACILYGSIWNNGLRQEIGSSLTPVKCLMWIAILVVSMLMLAWTWNWYKRSETTLVRTVRFAVFLLAIAYSVA
jgi:uncharacterized membrane protein